MSNAYVRLKQILPPTPVLVGRVTAHHADDTSTVELPTNEGSTAYAAGVAVGSTIRARGTTVAVGDKAFVRDGVIETRAPDEDAVEIVVGTVVALPTPLAFSGPISDQAGTVGAAFTLDLTPFWAGGTAPLTWSVAAGALPAGLALASSTGVVSGTPTVDGTFGGVVFRATDMLANYVDGNAVEFEVAAASAGLFVAVGSTVKTSSDGVTWASHTPPITAGWRGVAYGGGLFVAVNVMRQPDMVMTSPDGAAWTMRNGDTTQTGWKSIAYGNGVFVATRAVAGTQSVMSSPDGVNWTLRTHASFGPISAIAFGGGVFVAVASSGTNTQRVMTSVDGETWTIRTTPNLARTWTCAAYAQGKFVIGSASSVNPAYVLTSSDGTSWSSGIRPEPYDAWESLIESPSGGFVGVTLDGGYLIRSSDGITWTSDYGITVPGLGYLASDGTRLVWAGYASPFITTSDDGGLTWTTRDTGSSFGYVTFGSP